MNRELLEKPFEPSQIKQREGYFGKKLDYIEGHCVIARLNDAFDADWSFSILEHRILEETDEVLVVGQLRASDVAKTQFGSSRITRARESGEPVSFADDFKAAATGSIKKCASLFGVGLHLYNGDKPANGQNANRNRQSYSNHGWSSGYRDRRSKSAEPDNGNGNARLTSRQFKYIMRLADEAGRHKNELDQETLQMFGSAVQFLSKSDASSYIEHLLSK
jgi:hypothetical protein